MARKINKKSIIVFVISLIVFLALAIPFRDLLRVNYVTEVRPAAVLNTVLGIFFGMPAILGTTLGNTILDIQSGYSIIEAIIYMIPQFLYGFVAYWVWQKYNKRKADSKTIDGMPKIISFIVATIAASLIFAVVGGLEVGLFNSNIQLLIDFMIFVFVNNSVMNLFLGFPLIIALDRFVNKNKNTLCEKYLLMSSALETVFVAAIIGVNYHMNANSDISNSQLWEKIYFMCIAAILFIIGIAVVVIALKLDKELKEQNYDINVASTIQTSMLPTKFDLNDERVDVYAYMRPAKSVGGDFYDFYYIDKNHLAFLIADVSGKGIPAALFMMRATSTIRNYAKLGLKVDEIIQKANASLSENNRECYFVTVWMGIIDLETGMISYCNAGHNAPAIITNNEQSKLIETDKAIILGVAPEAQYFKHEMSLSEDSIIYLYTDGVTEARNVNKEMFKEARLLSNLDKVDKSPRIICENMVQAIDEFCGKADQFDDITMLALKYKKKSKTI